MSGRNSETRNREQDLLRLARDIGDQTPVNWDDEVNRDPGLANKVSGLRNVERLAAAHWQIAKESEGEPHPDLIGSLLLLRYRILDRIGEGNMGIVYRARDERLGKIVAIKVVHEKRIADEGARQILLREARIACSVNHPNVAAVFDVGESEGRVFFAMEYVEGTTLSDAIPLPESTVVDYGIQIASALQAVHEAGIVHRDLKSLNVRINGTGLVKVLDFGIAVRTSAGPFDATITLGSIYGPAGMLAGTPAYMAPELLGGGPPDRRSDTWALGVTLYEALTGQRPFVAESWPKLEHSILHDDPPSLPGSVRRPLRRLIEHSLKKDPGHRYQQAGEIRAALEAIRDSTSPVDGAKGAGGEKSIAVLPFAHASGPDDEYFADGITEEIMNALAQLEGLRVAARTSSFTFKSRKEDLRQISETLRVSTILEGSVRRAGNRLRITVQLVNAADGFQLWSERYDREVTDVFEVQDEIANSIAAKLKVTLAGGAERVVVRRGTSSLEAYDLFLKGRALQYQRGRFINEASQCFEQAIALDPRYADALAWMADNYRLRGTFGMAPFDDVMPKAKAVAQRALAIDPNVAEAHATLADVEAQYGRDYARANDSWERALTLDPRHIRARCERATWSLCFGGFDADRAVAEVERAVAEDPLNAWAAGMHSVVLGLAGRYNEGIDSARRAVELDAGSFFAQWHMVRSHAWAGQFARAINLGQPLLISSGRHPWALGTLAMAHARSGNVAVARAIFDELEARSRMEFISPAMLSVAAVASGLEGEAMQWAERAVDGRDAIALWMRVFPEWAPLRSKPGFDELMAKMGSRTSSGIVSEG